VEISLIRYQQLCCREIFSCSDDNPVFSFGGVCRSAKAWRVSCARCPSRYQHNLPFDAIGIQHWFHVL
jgi:hypothetical protein